MPACFYSFSLSVVIFTPPTSKHISISIRRINHRRLWGPVCQELFHRLQQSPRGSLPADWQAHGKTSTHAGRPATGGLHPGENPREGSPPNHGQVTSCFLKSHLPRASLTFPLPVTTDFQSSKKEKKKHPIQCNDIKSQQDKNLVAAIQSKTLPPAHLLVLSLVSYF